MCKRNSPQKNEVSKGYEIPEREKKKKRRRRRRIRNTEILFNKAIAPFEGV